MNEYEKALLNSDDIPISEDIDCHDVFCYIERLKNEKKQAITDILQRLKRVWGTRAKEYTNWDGNKVQAVTLEWLNSDIDETIADLNELLAEVTGE